MNKKLFDEYIKYFGDKPPYPPEHIMETLVEMKKNNTYDEMMEKIKPFMKGLRKEVEDVSGEEMSLDHPVFKVDMRDKKKK